MGLVTQNAVSAQPEQRLRPNAAYVVRAPQTTPPPYAGQGGVDRLRERIGARFVANIGALVVLAAARALVGARRQRRQLAALQPRSAG